MRSTGCDRRQQASASLRFLWLLQTPVSPDSHQISPVITEYHPLSPKPLAGVAVKVPQGQSRLKDFPLPTPPNPTTSEYLRPNPSITHLAAPQRSASLTRQNYSPSLRP